MANFPVPDPKDEAFLVPPFVGIAFTYVTVDHANNGKLMLVQETMLDTEAAAKYQKQSPRVLELTFGPETSLMTPGQVRFIVKGFIALFQAQAEFIEKRRSASAEENEAIERPESLCPAGTVETVILDCLKLENGEYFAQLVKKGSAPRKQYHRREVMLTENQIALLKAASCQTMNWPTEDHFTAWVQDHEV